jgi:hypothetical protein
MIGRISESVFRKPRYFIPGVEMRITLRRCDPVFPPVSSAEQTESSSCPYKIEYDEAILYVKKHVISPQIIAMHEKQLSARGKLYWPLRSYEIRSFSISTGTQNVTSETLFRNNPDSRDQK